MTIEIERFELIGGFRKMNSCLLFHYVFDVKSVY